jgi:adenylate cyclase
MAQASVRIRLLAAFLGISVFAVIAAGAAMYAFSRVGASLERITRRDVPSVLISQELARDAERIVAAAPALLRVTTADEYDQLSTKVTSDVARLNELLARLKESNTKASTLEPIERLVNWLSVNLISLNTIAFNNLSLARQRQELLGELSDTYSGFRALLIPRIESLEGQAQLLQQKIDNPRSASEIGAARELSRVSRTLLSLKTVQLQGENIHNAFLRAASAASRSEVEDLAVSLEVALGDFKTLVASLSPALRRELLPTVERLQAFAAGRDSILLLRERQLENSDADRQLAEHVNAARDLTKAVELMVSGAKRDIEASRERSLSVQRNSAEILLAIVVLSLLGSGLIVWLYVHRNLIARLTALSGSMSAIAAGKLDAHVPHDGRDEIGRMAQALAVFRDTAVEVDDAHRQTATAQQRLLDAIESVSDGFALYDAQDRLVICNSRYRQLSQPGAADAVQPGMAFETIIHRAAARGLIRDAEGRVDAWVAERLEKHRSPSEPHVQERANGTWIRITECKTADGGTVAVYTDITVLKRREQELSELVAELETARDRAMQAARAKSTFLASMSHELRTPLNAIIGFSEVLLEKMFGELNEKQEEYLKDIHSSGTHLLRLINDILDLSSIEAGKLKLEPHAVNLRELLQDSLVLMKEQALAHGIDLDLRVDDGIDIVVADEQKVKRIVYNMLSNAVKFTPTNGKAGIKARRTDEGVEIDVWDTGVGITAADQGRIFEEFHQLGDGLSAKPEGTGLGLTLTKKLVELHGGRIWVKSSPGEGSTFTFTLPPKIRAELRKQA